MTEINPSELTKFVTLVKSLVDEIEPEFDGDDEVCSMFSALKLALSCGQGALICKEFGDNLKPYIEPILAGDEKFFMQDTLKVGGVSNVVVDTIRSKWTCFEVAKQNLIKLRMKKLLVSCYVNCLRDVFAVAKINSFVGVYIIKPYTL